jgi:hypothetical protein
MLHCVVQQNFNCALEEPATFNLQDREVRQNETWKYGTEGKKLSQIPGEAIDIVLHNP